jgi:hypothetical protein
MNTLKTLLESNTHIDLKKFNFLDKEAIQKLEFKGEDPTEALSQLMGYQRLLRLTDCDQTAQALFEKGSHSVFQITNIARSEFVKNYAKYCLPKQGGTAKQQAAHIYDKALTRKSQVVNTYIGIHQHNSAHYKSSRFDSLSTTTAANFNSVPSYEDLFGGLDFCTCPECRTIFSPAAYFVDLMQVRKKYIIPESGKDQKLLLETRRPDLWTTELSCKNTNTLIPSITIVNEVLTQSIGKKTENGEEMNKAVYPFNLPYNLPLTETSFYLQQQNTSLATLWKTLSPDPKNNGDQARNIQLATLGLSTAQWKLYTTEVTEEKTLKKYYGLTEITDGSLISTLTPVEKFLQQTGLTYVQLRELVYQGLSQEQFVDDNHAIAKTFFINVDNAKLEPLMFSEEENLETKKKTVILKNLTSARLDRLNRFIRLAQALNWSFTDLNWVLLTAGNLLGENVAVLTDAALPFLSWVKTTHDENSGMSINEICAVQGTLKNYGTNGEPSLLDQVFFNDNIPYRDELKLAYSTHKLNWKVPEFDPANVAEDNNLKIQAALVAALKISVNELLLVVNEKFPKDSDPNLRVLSLTLENLSSLYRCSQLKKLYGLSIPEVFIALGLPGAPENAIPILVDPIIINGCAVETEVNNMPLQSVLEWMATYAQWVKQHAVSTYQLEYLLTGASSMPQIQNQILGDEAMINFYRDFQQSISDCFLTEEKLSQALSTIANENQYSKEAQEYVFNEIKDEVTKDKIKEIVASVFPKANVALYESNIEKLADVVYKLYNESKNSNNETGVKTEPITLANFIKTTKLAFTNAMVFCLLPESIWAIITDPSNSDFYVSKEIGIVIKNGEHNEKIFGDTFKDLFFLSQFSEGNLVNDTLLKNLTTITKDTTIAFYEAQQNVFVQETSTLYNLEAETFAPILESVPAYPNGIDQFQPLTLNDLIAPTDESSPENKENLKTALQNLQVYAALVKVFSLSAAETFSLTHSPQCYGMAVKNTEPKSAAFFLTLENLQTITKFKDMVLVLNDSQNHVLNYLKTVPNADFDKASTLLHQLTQWNTAQIQFLFGNLWEIQIPENNIPQKNNTSSLQHWDTIEGLYLITQWFLCSEALDLDVTSLWQLYELSNTTIEEQENYNSYKQAAADLWGGLSIRFEKKPEVLQAVKTHILIQNRNALAPYVLNTLRKNVPGLSNYRDLSNYLLIDIEVGSEVETSLIGSAISTLQLYVHRCLNNLEKDVRVLDELEQWWEWMGNYRVWEANRRVFLFPENYIEPELRKDKTPLFTQLETDLQSANLKNPAAIEAALYTYMDGFAEVANLEVVGSAGYDYTVEVITDEVTEGEGVPNEECTKTFCLVGRTPQEPYQYYYRLVLFMKEQDSDQYFPVNWEPWYKINLGLQPVGPVKPVFAFGKWFITWVEQQQTGSKKVDDEEIPTYTAECKLSFLNFNKEWVTPQTIGKIAFEEEILSTNASWNQLYPSYLNSVELLVLVYGKKAEEQKAPYVFEYGQSGLTKGLKLASRYAGLKQLYPKNLLNPEETIDGSFEYQYWEDISSTKTYDNFSVGDGDIISTSDYFYFDGNSSDLLKISFPKTELNLKVAHLGFVNYSYKMFDEKGNIAELTINDKKTELLHFKKNKWNYLSVELIGQSENILLPDVKSTSNIFNYQGKLLIININKPDLAQPFALAEVYMNGDISDKKPLTTSTEIKDVTSVSLAEIEGKLYAYWIDVNNSCKIGCIDLEKYLLIEIQSLYYMEDKKRIEINPKYLPAIASIYIVWIEKDKNINSHASFGKLDHKTGKISPMKKISNSCAATPSMALSMEKMYFYVYESVKCTTLYYFNPEEINISLKYITMFDGYGGNLANINDIIYLTVCKGKTTCLYELIPEFISDNSRNLELIDKLEVECRDAKPILFNEHIVQVWAKNDVCHLQSPSHLIIDCNGINHVITFRNRYFYSCISPENLTVKVDLKHKFGIQENLVFISKKRILQQKLYNNSRPYITRGYQDVVFDKNGEVNNPDKYFNPEIAHSNLVTDQPGWQMYNKDGIQLLTGLQKNREETTVLSCYRLNTTAFDALSQTLYMRGIPGLLSIASQRTPEIPFQVLHPNGNTTGPSDTIDFNGGAMSRYYWEIFFFMPFLIAKSLHNQQLPEDAQKWYDYIFNPTINKANWDLETGEAENDRYWRFIGLRSAYNPVLKQELDLTWSAEVQVDTKNQEQLYAYHNDPFNPHTIAGLRPIAYQKTMVMHYIDNLLKGGDKLFRQFTVEAIVEAYMLYMMAYDLLGNEPQNLGACVLPKDEKLEELLKNTTKNDNEFLLFLEQSLARQAGVTKIGDTPINYIPNSYFGLPENELFMAYWDTVKERLYSIRHGLNIDGVRQKLDLFQPAIDPMKLVEQIANGASISGAMANLSVTYPLYRFSVMIQLAKNTTQTVMQFGQSLLSALEKKDAEQLSLMYNHNQLTLLQQTTASKQAQVDSLSETLESLKYSKKSAEERYNYYTELIDEGLSGEEEAQLGQMIAATSCFAAASVMKPFAAGLDSVPNIFGFAVGGQKYSAVPAAIGIVSQISGEILNQTGNITGIYAGYGRRSREWEFQKKTAEKDKQQLEHQIFSTKYQKEAAIEEVKLLKKSIDQEQKVQQFLKNKFTNQQLYQWMSGKLAAQYFQCYQIAYEMSLQAQQAWNFERGTAQSYIKGGYWDGLHQGLLAGEALMTNLMQMENAFMLQNKRRLEIQKTISLNNIASEAITSLKTKGVCMFEFTDDLFANDYPGHYCRQIVSLSVSFPTLIGPYQNIHATLTQLSNTTILKSKKDLVEKVKNGESDPDIRKDVQVNQQIALSQGVNDSGMFTLNFNDERYLPFEGTGAVSSWKLEMPKETNPLILDNLTDVIIQLNYTALA